MGPQSAGGAGVIAVRASADRSTPGRWSLPLRAAATEMERELSSRTGPVMRWVFRVMEEAVHWQCRLPVEASPDWVAPVAAQV